MRTSATDKDTICALSTAHGIGAISVIRVSGTQAAQITRKLAAFLPENLESHKIYYGILKSLDGSRAIDEVLVAYFAQGRSFTGEHVFEISCHGSESVVNEILRELVSAGARPAERGEFTYRAFIGGRLDLVQAESVLAMIESRSSRASQLALRQLQGEFSNRLKSMRDQLTWVLAHLEANIDFAAEDIEIASDGVLSGRLEKLAGEVQSLIDSYKQGRIVREGFHVALAGKPNAGKSSLLNAFAGEERAIVTEVPGTTRDFVETELTLAGIRVTLVDTAVLRMSSDRVEKIGIERTLEKLKTADLVFYVADASEGVSEDEREFFSSIPWDRTVWLSNKMDLGKSAPPPAGISPLASFEVSAVLHSGLREVKAWMEGRLRSELSEDSTLVSNARHFRGLLMMRDSLEKSIPLVSRGASPDLIALELQTGLMALYEILGITFDDQVMDQVFKEFCLGK
jgi:tRNA modification GTPase